MAQLLSTRVNAAFTLTQQAPSMGSVATQRYGSCNAIGYIKSHSWLQLGSRRIGGRGVQLSFSVSLQTARGRNDAEIVWRCQVERKEGGGDCGGWDTAGERGRERGQRLPEAHGHWMTLQLRCASCPHNPAKAKSCCCCYPSIPAKSGTMLPGNSSAHKQCHKAADSPLKENSPSNTSQNALKNPCHSSC